MIIFRTQAANSTVRVIIHIQNILIPEDDVIILVDAPPPPDNDNYDGGHTFFIFTPSTRVNGLFMI